MVRKFLVPLALVVVFCTAVLAVSLAMTQGSARSAGLPPSASAPGAPPDQITGNGVYLWSYAAKFVCGVQAPLQAGTGGAPGEPVFKPGNYATDINIHNPNYVGMPIVKKLILLVNANQAAAPLIVRETETAAATANVNMDLPSAAATLDDCNQLYKMAYGQFPTAPIAIMSGYLVILSRQELDIDVVYTAAEPGDVTASPVAISENVNRVTGKRIFIPAGVQP